MVMKTPFCDVRVYWQEADDARWHVVSERAAREIMRLPDCDTVELAAEVSRRVNAVRGVTCVCKVICGNHSIHGTGVHE